MNRGSWLVHEMRLQMKNGMYMLYIGVACFYILAMSYVPVAYKPFFLSLIIFSDPTFLGMFFVGSIFLLEKQQGIPKAIGITPLGMNHYILGKVVSLLFISIVVSIGIVWMSGVGQVEWLKLMVGIVLSGALFTLFGLMYGTVVRHNNAFLMGVGFGSMVLALPLISFYQIWDVSIFNFIPTYSAMVLIEGGIRGSQQSELLHIIYLVIWNSVAMAGTKKLLVEKVFRG